MFQCSAFVFMQNEVCAHDLFTVVFPCDDSVCSLAFQINHAYLSMNKVDGEVTVHGGLL